MKIVCIGDLLLPPEMMERATENFQRYDEKRYFYFGPKSHEEMRIYIKNMETAGSRCVPVPDDIMREIVDADVIQTHQCPIPSEVFEKAGHLKLLLTNRG